MKILLSIFTLFISVYPSDDKTTIPVSEVMVNSGGLVVGNYIIATPDKFRELCDNSLKYKDVESGEWIKIDFEKYFLIGIKTAVGGCSMPIADYKLQLTEGKYIFNCEIIQVGLCKRLNHLE